MNYLFRLPQIRGRQYRNLAEVSPLQDHLNLSSIECTACEIQTCLLIFSRLLVPKSRYFGVNLNLRLFMHKTLQRHSCTTAKTNYNAQMFPLEDHILKTILPEAFSKES